MMPTPGLTPDSKGSPSSSEAPSPVQSSKSGEDVIMTEASDLEATEAVSRGVALKRKSEDAKVPPAKKAKKDEKAKTTEPRKSKEKKEKKEKAAPTVLELKNKKLVYKTKPISLEAQVVALQQRLALTQYLNEATEPLEEVPEEHYGALAKIVHESDRTLDQLAKSLRTTFAPQTGSSASIDADNPPIDVLPLSIVKSAISSMATRTNFGLTSSDLDGKEIPGLAVYRWHVDEWEKLVAEGLPSEMVEKLQKRVDEREGLHDIAVGLLDALDEKSKKALLEGKEKKDAKGKKKEDAIDVDGEKVKKVKKGKAKAEKDASEDEEVEEKVKETPEEKAAKKAEREAKKAEREAKKAAAAIKKAEKEEAKAAKDAEKAEKEADRKKKQAALEKQSASAFGSFFVKPKAPASASSAKHARKTSDDQSDFDKSFLAFNITKNVEVAPVNQCIASSSSVKAAPVDVKINSLSEITLKDSMASLLRNASPSSIPKYDPRPKAFASVKDIMHNISEGDLTGTGGNKWYKLLANRTQVPVKVLSFNHTDRRPGYVGTFTKTSDYIRPRKPFNKDTDIFDYDYDSEEAWDDEVADGEDVNSDTAKSDTEMDDAASDDNSVVGEDGEGWMCDDDHVEYIAGFADEDDSADRAEDETLRDDEFKARQRAQQKRNQAQKDSAARAKAAKILVPVQRGPCWENGTKSVYKGFEGMQIRFLNDAYSSLDPFTFVSKAGLKPEVKKENKPLLAVQPTIDGKPASEGMKRSNSGNAKKPFPEHLLADLVTAIKASSCKNKPELIKELHEKFPSATKTSIEGLLKTFAEKKSDKGVVTWTVSDKIAV